MRTIFSAFAAILLCGCVSWAQQTPPAEGIGLGEPNTTSSPTASGVPATDAPHNQRITGTTGSTTGSKSNPAHAGSSGASTATRMKSQGNASASSSTTATDARRRASQQRRSSAQTNTKGQQSSTADQTDTGKRKGKNKNEAGGGEDKLLSPNMGPSNTESPGPSTGNNPEQKPPR